MATSRGLLTDLLRERRAALIGYAAPLTGDRVEAEDLVHNAIVRTFGRPRSFPHINAANVYVRRAIAGVFIDRARSQTSWFGPIRRLATDETSHEEDIAGRLDLRCASHIAKSPAVISGHAVLRRHAGTGRLKPSV